MTLLEPGTIELFRKLRNVGHLPKSQKKKHEVKHIRSTKSNIHHPHSCHISHFGKTPPVYSRSSQKTGQRRRWWVGWAPTAFVGSAGSQGIMDDNGLLSMDGSMIYPLAHWHSPFFVAKSAKFHHGHGFQATQTVNVYSQRLHGISQIFRWLSHFSTHHFSMVFQGDGFPIRKHFCRSLMMISKAESLKSTAWAAFGGFQAIAIAMGFILAIMENPSINGMI